MLNKGFSIFLAPVRPHRRLGKSRCRRMNVDSVSILYPDLDDVSQKGDSFWNPRVSDAIAITRVQQVLRGCCKLTWGYKGVRNEEQLSKNQC